MNLATRSLGTLVLIALLCVPAAAQETDKPATGGTNLRIAVADIARIFESYSRRIEYQGKLEATGKSLREREQLLRARISRLEDDISKLAMGHPQRVELLNELVKQRDEFRQFSVEARKELDDTVRKSTRLLYADIVEVIEEYARFHNIDLVIKQQSFKPDQATAENQAHSIGRRTVLYCAPEIDITDAIITILNDRSDKKED